MIGILGINKPTGITSRQVVSRVYQCIKPNKTGHAGTLDPLAQGVLLVPIGSAGRLTPYLHQLPKHYDATFALGRSSDSDDSETDVTIHPDLIRPSIESLQQALRVLQDSTLQRPPAYSAIKVDGRRSYDRARQGTMLDLPERPVKIHALELLDYDFPELRLRIVCGSGTYVRSIGRDLAEAVGTKAIMTALTRTQIGPFSLAQCADLNDVNSHTIAAAMRPALDGVTHLPQVHLSAAQLEHVLHGRNIAVPPSDIRPGVNAQQCWSARGRSDTLGTEIAAIAPDGRLAALLVPTQHGLKPHRVFPQTK